MGAPGVIRSMDDVSDPAIGEALHAQIAELYPICRSLTGPGVRETLDRLRTRIPIETVETPTGAAVLDWTVPKEWSIRDAYVADTAGRRVIDFRRHNLHVVSYSRPVRARMTLAELRPHLHTDPEHPDWIPYRTSYYVESWGFCLAHRDLLALEEGEYDVVIDSTLADGALTYGECVVPGRTSDEILISAHICHPSLCNDNLSSIVIATEVARRLLDGPPPRHTVRFVFAPATIGAIVWLAHNEDRLARLRHGLVLANLGDTGPPNYKHSRRGDAAIDRAAALAIASAGGRLLPFEPYGYDERQYCSPGFDLPVGCLSRTTYGQFPEYHTSADDLDFVRPEALAGSLALVERIIDTLERDATYVNLSPKGEPMLGRRGLYGAIGGRSHTETLQLALLWTLNFCDGRHSLIDIAERSGLGFAAIAEAAEALEAHNLLARAS